MADKILVCISAQQATAGLWRGGELARVSIFDTDEAGFEAFKAYLGGFRAVPVFVIVDTVEEDYRFETLPHVYGADRTAMVTRKIKHYRNTPYVAAWRQGRDSGKRKDDRYLFAALTNPELIAVWIRMIAEAELPLAGLYLLPMVTASMLEKIEVRAGNLLVVASHAGGLRLTFFRERQFRLSRLTRGELKGSDRARLFAEEISNTRLYLHALRTTTLDEHLAVLVIDRNDDLTEVVQHIARENPSLECIRLGSAELSQRLRVDKSILALSSDALYMQLLGQRTPACNLAPAALTKGYSLHQTRRHIYMATMAIGVSAFGWSGFNTWRAYDTANDLADAQQQTVMLQSQYKEITRQFPAAPTSAENLKRAVELAELLRQNIRTPDRAFIIVSRAIEPWPQILIRELGWRYGVEDIDASGGETRLPDAAGTVAPQVAAGTRRQTALIDGEIRSFRGDYRAAIDLINELAGRLSSDPEVAEVRTIKLPLNVNPSLSLSGNTVESQEQNKTAEFKLLIVLKNSP
jgi:hypothetical protein